MSNHDPGPDSPPAAARPRQRPPATRSTWRRPRSASAPPAGPIRPWSRRASSTRPMRRPPRSGCATTPTSSRSSRSTPPTTPCPPGALGELWLERTPPDFTFDIKAHALMTGQPSEVKRLPKEIREELPLELLDKKRGSTARTCRPSSRDAIWDQFRTGSRRSTRPASWAPSSSSTRAGSSPRTRAATRSSRRRSGWGTSAWRSSSAAAPGSTRRTPSGRSRFLEKYQIPFVMVDEPQTRRAAAADRGRHLTRAGGGPLPRPAHRDLGGEGHPGGRALPLPVRRR